MSRETVSLICAELPGAEKVSEAGDADLWAIAHEPFARVGEAVEVRDGAGWVAVPALDDHDVRERIVESYEQVRHSLPEEVRVTLDRTSG